MNAQPIPVDSPVLTDEQVDAYIDYQMAQLTLLLAKRRRTFVVPANTQRLRDQRAAS